MSLLRLPHEVLGMIFDYIPSSDFQKDLSLLTISRKWLEFALPAFFRDLTFDPGRLIDFVPHVSRNQPYLSDSIDTLHLHLAENWPVGSWPAIGDSEPEHEQETGSSPESQRSRASTPEEEKPLSRQLSDGFHQLGAVCRKSRRLRVLEIRACPPFQPYVGAYDPPPAYVGMHLPFRPMREILSVERLSVLVIDTHAKFTRPNSGPDGGVDDHIHICPLIAAHLTSLTKLHIRMRTLCPDILKVPGDKRDLRLKNLVINFYQPRTGEFTHSMRCTTGQEPPAGVGVMRLMDDIRRHALILKTKMKSPEILRLLTFQLPSFNVHSYDLLKGRTMVLGSRRAWDEDGGVVDEEWEPEPPSEPDGEFTEHLDGFN